MVSRAGVPHTPPHGVLVHDAFPSFPPNQKKNKLLQVSNQAGVCDVHIRY